MKNANVIAVINSPFFDSNMRPVICESGRHRYLHLLPIRPENISSCKNLASRVATRAHAFYSKKAWKRDIDYAIEKGYDDYYKAEGKGHYDDHTLELIIKDGMWTSL